MDGYLYIGIFLTTLKSHCKASLAALNESALMLLKFVI